MKSLFFLPIYVDFMERPGRFRPCTTPSWVPNATKIIIPSWGLKLGRLSDPANGGSSLPTYPRPVSTLHRLQRGALGLFGSPSSGREVLYGRDRDGIGVHIERASGT